MQKLLHLKIPLTFVVRIYLYHQHPQLLGIALYTQYPILVLANNIIPSLIAPGLLPSPLVVKIAPNIINKITENPIILFVSPGHSFKITPIKDVSN